MKKIINLILVTLSVSICATETPWYAFGSHVRNAVRPAAQQWAQRRTFHTRNYNYTPQVQTETALVTIPQAPIPRASGALSLGQRLFSGTRNILAAIGLTSIAGAVILREEIGDFYHEHVAQTDLRSRTQRILEDERAKGKAELEAERQEIETESEKRVQAIEAKSAARVNALETRANQTEKRLKETQAQLSDVQEKLNKALESGRSKAAEAQRLASEVENLSQQLRDITENREALIISETEKPETPSIVPTPQKDEESTSTPAPQSPAKKKKKVKTWYNSTDWWTKPEHCRADHRYDQHHQEEKE